MHYASVLALAVAVASVIAAPTPIKNLVPRASQRGQWDSIQTGTYTLYSDLWNEYAGTGSQCSEVTSASGSTIA